MTNWPSTLADGRYLLVKPLGEGGMALVFRAFDQRLQTWRAIKILSPEYASKPRLASRFEAEAQTMALLEHKHIVRVYDVGHDGPYAYIVMEIVEGGTLVDWLERHGVMPPRLAVDVMLQVCDGIQAAHHKGVIHRDIKPHNMMVGTDGVVRVTDFGIARVGDTDSALTKTGAVMGTWGYMAPEQRSNAKTVDVRADVYALAATLYTLISNKMPMDLFAADRDASMMAGLPLELVDVLLKASDYSRDNRYASVAELAQALRDVRGKLPDSPEDTPPLARAPGAPPPIPKAADYVRSQDDDPVARRDRASHTILPDEANSSLQHAMTLPPSDGELVDGPLPQQDRALFTPGVGRGIDPSRHATPGPALERGARPKSSAFTFVGWAMAGVFALAGVSLIGVAGLIYAMQSGDPEVVGSAVEPEIAAPAEVAEIVPEKAPAEALPAEVAVAEGVAETAPSKSPSKTPSKRPDPVKAATETKAPTEAKDPVPGAVAQPVVVQVAQCLKLTPPARPTVGSDAVFKAALCTEDGTPVTLWYRAAGGTWQSRLMPKALGAHTAKITLDEAFRGGLEYYVEAGGVAEGSQAQPRRLEVQ